MASLEGFEPISLTRHKHDPGWKHCQVYVRKEENGVKVELRKCIYCGKTFKGGGIHRIKEHLAGRKGNGPTCDKVPPDVRLSMQYCLTPRIPGAKRKKRRGNPPDNSNVSEMNNSVVDHSGSPMFSMPNNFLLNGEGESGVETDVHMEKGKRGKVPSSSAAAMCMANVNNSMESSFNLTSIPSDRENVDFRHINWEPIRVLDSNMVDVEIHDGCKNLTKQGIDQTSAFVDNDRSDHDVILKSGINLRKEDYQKVHMAIGRFLYEIGAPPEAVKNSVCFQSMIDTIASVGVGIPAPSYHDLRGWILKDVVKEVKDDVDKHKTLIEKHGCSLLVNRWSSGKGKISLSFVLHSLEGTSYLKSVDVSDNLYSSDALSELLKQVIEEVGVRNILQVVTDNEENYIGAWKRLTNIFPNLFWAPCASHCIDLMLDDFGKIDWICSIINQARSVTRYVYQNSIVLNMMRTYTNGYDIVRPGLTRSATNFSTLKRMADHKLNLQAMVISQDWIDCPYSKTPGGSALQGLINDRSFWSSCILITQLTDPLLQVLDIISRKKRAAMGYIFAAMYWAKETIKKELINRESYMFFWNIIDNRWKQLRHLPLLAAGFYLNPKFFYSVKGDIHHVILSAVFDCIKRLVPETNVQDKIIDEMNLYKNAVGDLGRNIAIRARYTLLPVEWWSTYGGCCPHLARLAVRILSQTCSSIGYEGNHIPFEQIHETANFLERQRVVDHIFVQYNLQLKEMDDEKKELEAMDPISLDIFDIVEDWISEKEALQEDSGCSDWKSIKSVPNMMSLGPPVDEAEDLSAGFDIHEIFHSLTEVKEQVFMHDIGYPVGDHQ